MPIAQVVVTVLVALLAASLALVLRTALDRRRQADAHVRQVAQLVGAISGADWVRSLQALTTQLVEAGVCRAAVVLFVAENGALEHRASFYSPGAPQWTPNGETAFRQVVERGERLATSDGWLLLPVAEDRESVGVLALLGARPESPVLPAAVRLAALSLGSMRLHQKQAVLSTTDGLTGLANHRHFQQTLSVALAQAYLEGEPLSVILLDIDHFKLVNDTHGHLFGDLVLREMAYLLRRELPPDAMPARYGGEEFVVVLRGTPVERAAAIAEGLREAIMTHQTMDLSSGARLSVTVSLGVAGYELGQGKGRLMARADEALYESKHGGRNRVTVAAPENSTSHLFPS
ncbi:MAG TPA: GGDEF domain-containing protein [Symbiobacteriaceae bacterium]|jgi:diguanylate cyclase (GGDEF)-like protein|nr:GGDEF domain-containing protein [Symbiobacteriaceae bacterium]